MLLFFVFFCLVVLPGVQRIPLVLWCLGAAVRPGGVWCPVRHEVVPCAAWYCGFAVVPVFGCLVPAEDVACVDFLPHVVEHAVVAVGNDGV